MVYFDGPDDPGKTERLTGQLERIFTLMKDGVPRTLSDISLATGDPPASISAQLRHLRKPRFGSHTVHKEHVGGGLYTYQLIVNQAEEANSHV
jgi:hypothetical protein